MIIIHVTENPMKLDPLVLRETVEDKTIGNKTKFSF